MNSDFEVGEIRTEEIEQSLVLVKRSVIELAVDFYSPEQIDAWVNQYPTAEVFAAWRRRRTMLVARKQDTLVGFGQIQFDRKEIVGVHVLPTESRRGIGSLLVESLESAGVGAGLTEIVIQASLNAVDFYQACGYQPVKKIEFEYSNGVKSNALFMRKKLVDVS